MKYQNLTAQQGDILIVRSGYVRWHKYERSNDVCTYTAKKLIHLSSSNADTAERKRGTQENSIAIGLQNNEATVRWLYDQHFAAVAGDTVAFEGKRESPRFQKVSKLIDSSSVATANGVGLVSSRVVACAVGHADWRDVGS